MSEIMEAGTGLGIRKPEVSPLESIPESEREKTEQHLERIKAGVVGIRKNDPEMIPGMVGYVGSIKWQRVPVNEVSFCAKCGDLLGSEYGVVEYGNVDGPYYCMPDHLQEAKGTGV